MPAEQYKKDMVRPVYTSLGSDSFTKLREGQLQAVRKVEAKSQTKVQPELPKKRNFLQRLFRR